MLGKTFSRFKKRKDQREEPVSSTSSQTASPLGDISKMLSASGRIGLTNLRRIASENDKDSFIRFVRQPVLAGAAIQAGRISSQDGSGGGEELNRTQIFEPSNTNPGASDAGEAPGLVLLGSNICVRFISSPPPLLSWLEILPAWMAAPARTGCRTNRIKESFSFSWAILRKLARPIRPEALNILEISPRGDAACELVEEAGSSTLSLRFLNRENVLPSIYPSLLPKKLKTLNYYNILSQKTPALSRFG